MENASTETEDVMQSILGTIVSSVYDASKDLQWQMDSVKEISASDTL